jgi:uncharacterized membrane protein YphA (DoxX/SURF4 family)
MTTDFLLVIAQAAIGLTILNVWLFRFRVASSFRGGGAANMREEFAAYGLPSWSILLVGGAKVALAVALLIGIWIRSVTLPAAAGLAAFMLAAVAFHLKAGDPLVRSAPAAVLLGLLIVVVLRA